MYQTSGVAAKTSSVVDQRDRRSEPPAEDRQHAGQADGAGGERAEQRRPHVREGESERDGIAGGGRGQADRAADRVDQGDGEIERQPDERRTDRHEVARPRRLPQVGELARDVEVAIEDQAAELREVDRAVGGDARRVGHLHAERVEQHDSRGAHQSRAAADMRPATASPARRAATTETTPSTPMPVSDDQPCRRTRRRDSSQAIHAAATRTAGHQRRIVSAGRGRSGTRTAAIVTSGRRRRTLTARSPAPRSRSDPGRRRWPRPRGRSTRPAAVRRSRSSPHPPGRRRRRAAPGVVPAPMRVGERRRSRGRRPGQGHAAGRALARERDRPGQGAAADRDDHDPVSARSVRSGRRCAGARSRCRCRTPGTSSGGAADRRAQQVGASPAPSPPRARSR